MLSETGSTRQTATQLHHTTVYPYVNGPIQLARELQGGICVHFADDILLTPANEAEMVEKTTRIEDTKAEGVD